MSHSAHRGSSQQPARPTQTTVWPDLSQVKHLPYANGSLGGQRLPTHPPFTVEARASHPSFDEAGRNLWTLVFPYGEKDDGTTQWWRIKTSARKPLVNDHTPLSAEQYVDFKLNEIYTILISRRSNGFRVMSVQKGGRLIADSPSTPTVLPGGKVLPRGR